MSEINQEILEKYMKDREAILAEHERRVNLRLEMEAERKEVADRVALYERRHRAHLIRVTIAFAVMVPEIIMLIYIAVRVSP